MKEVGPDAFDYGLLIGDENACKLIKDETADISITFPHRSLQEFLAAYFFVWFINDKKKSEFKCIAPDQMEMLMTNPLFLRFCLWFLRSGQKYLDLINSCQIYNHFVDHCRGVLNITHLNLKHVAQIYPSLDLPSAFRTKDDLRLMFLRDTFAKCNMVRTINLESVEILNFVLTSLSSQLKNISTVFCENTMVHFSKNGIVASVGNF